jgi:hypothetical protein
MPKGSSSFTILANDEAWQKGADLWVFSREPSKALARLDWLLNFQISNAALHHKKALPEKIQEILKKSALKSMDFIEDGRNNLLISSHLFIPAQWVLLLDDAGAKLRTATTPEEWTLNVYKNWLALGKLRLRVFLPDMLTSSQFEKIWGKHCSDPCEITLVNTRTVMDKEAP